MIRTIVVGYDGSESADIALDRAEELALALRSRLVVATVRSPSIAAFAVAPLGGVVVPPVAMESMGVLEDESAPPGTSEWERRLAGIQERLTRAGIDASTTSAIGTPIEELVEVADELAADLLVVGTHEPGLLERILSGSISQAVARRAHCDVLVVHPHSRGDRAGRSAAGPA